MLAASGNTYSIPAGGAMPASSGNWSFGSDLGIDTVLTLDNSFPGAGGPVKVALLTDGSYEMYANGVVNNQHGTYTRTYSLAPPFSRRRFSASSPMALNRDLPVAFQWFAYRHAPSTSFPSLMSNDWRAVPNRSWRSDCRISSSVTVTILVPRMNVYGENTSTLIISNATTADAGKYSVRVSNADGVRPEH